MRAIQIARRTKTRGEQPFGASRSDRPDPPVAESGGGAAALQELVHSSAGRGLREALLQVGCVRAPL